MTTISAKTILRSRNAYSDRVLSTLLLRYPRFIHAELMTHRALSRNAASSRAIPVKKIIDDILADTAMPIHWGKNQKGMQADEECDAQVAVGWGSDDYVFGTRQDAWLQARDRAIEQAQAFDAAGYHKQVVNRLLEPFMHITVLASATSWQNFLALRDHPDAEPHIAMLARAIRAELDRPDNIQVLQPGQWHMPFASDPAERVAVIDWYRDPHSPYSMVDGGSDEAVLTALKKLSVARCASTSYKTVDGFEMTLDRAIALHDKLVASQPLHASPAEHVAQMDEPIMLGDYQLGWRHESQSGNFSSGYRQYRKMLPNEAVPG